MKKYRILYVLNDSHPLKYFLKNHIDYLNKLGCYEISVIMNNNNSENFDDYKINLFNFKIKRQPNLFSDLIILVKIIIHLIRYRYDIVHSITPKSGLLTAIAGYITFQKTRIHTFTGQVWANYTGFKRKVFKSIDLLIFKLNTHILTDSKEQRKYLVENKIGSITRIHVLNKGSICGVDLVKFQKSDNLAGILMKDLDIMDDDFVVLYVGRLNYDKGIVDLINAYVKFKKKNMHLIVLGRDESNIIYYIKNLYPNINQHNIRFINETMSPEIYMSIASILCLPSYREGFGNVVIEAAALGVPSVVSNIYGLKDSIIDGETGFFFEPGNIDDLYNKINFLYSDLDLLNKMKVKCKSFVFKNFDSKIISQSLAFFYLRCIKNE